MTPPPRVPALPLLLLVAIGLVPAAARPVSEVVETPEARLGAAAGDGFGPFVRLKRDEDGTPVRLQTAIVRYGPPAPDEKDETDGTDAAADDGDGVVVDLIAAVHVADRGYYKDLDELFREYEALLYELVKPDGAALPDGRPVAAADPLSMLLSMGLDHLGLASQTDHVDYTRANFVHADLSPERMWARVEERGDDALTLALGVAADTIRRANLLERRQAERAARGEPAPSPLGALEAVDPLELLLAPDGPMRIKRLLAEQLASAALEDGLGETLDTVLIDDRNDACMQAFRRELAAGAETIGVFYGAAHMPDLDRRLREEFGLERKKVVWHTAWDLR